MLITVYGLGQGAAVVVAEVVGTGLSVVVLTTV
jgi:hypothetical protein